MCPVGGEYVVLGSCSYYVAIVYLWVFLFFKFFLFFVFFDIRPSAGRQGSLPHSSHFATIQSFVAQVGNHRVRPLKTTQLSAHRVMSVVFKTITIHASPSSAHWLLCPIPASHHGVSVRSCTTMAVHWGSCRTAQLSVYQVSDWIVPCPSFMGDGNVSMLGMSAERLVVR